jgi:hypothetical protein
MDKQPAERKMTEIHVLTITHGPVGTQESFFYKSKEAATSQRSAFELSNAGEFNFEDDFGNIGSIASIVHSIRQSNMEKSLDLQGEQSLMQARAQAKVSRAAASDPVLKLGGAMPGQVHPFPGR